MALQDFIVNNGLILGAANAVPVTSSTNQTGALQANGGVAIALNLIVGSTTTVYGPLTAPTIYDTSLTTLGGVLYSDANGQLIQTANMTYNAAGQQFSVTNIVSQIVTASNTLYVLGSSTATSNSTGALVVTGGAYLGKNLYVGSTSSNVNAVAGNSIITLGGIGITQDLFVGNNAIVTGNLTVLGTQTIFNSTTTAVADPVIDIGTGANDGVLVANDGYNKGLVIHYYDTKNNQMFLGRNNTTGYLVLFNNIGSTATNVPNANLINSGTYATMQLGTLIASSTASSTTTVAGNAIQVSGGVGVAGSMYVAGLIYGTSTQATSLSGGIAGQIPIQTAQGQTSFIGTGTTGYVLTWNSVNNTATWQAVSATANTATNIAGGAAWDIPFQIASGQTSFDNTFTYYNTSGNNILTINAVKIYGDGTDKGPGSAGNQIVDNNQSGIELYSTGSGFAAIDYGKFILVKVTSTGVILGATAKPVSIDLSGTISSNGLVINNAYSMPTNSGTNGYTLITNGSGQASWQPSAASLYFEAIGSTNTYGTVNLLSQTLEFVAGAGISLVANTQTLTIASLGINTVIAGTDTAISTSTNSITIWNTSTLQSVTSRGNTTTYSINIANTSATTSTTTGALTVVGGVGIGGSVYAGSVITATNFVANLSTTSIGSYLLNQGVYTYGNLSYNDINILSSLILNANNYVQMVLQNTNTGTTASTDFIVSNDIGGAANYYGDFGINSSVFSSYPGSLGLPNAVYLYSNNSDLVVGTASTNSTVHFVMNNIDAMIINSSTSVVVVGKTGTTSTNTGALQVVGGVGINGNVFVGGSVTATNIFGAGSNFGNIVITGTNAVNVGANSGTLWTSGGVNIQKDLYVGSTVTLPGTLNASGSVNLTGPTTISSLVATTSTITQLYVVGTATALTTTTGALQVTGGIGVGNNVYVGNRVGWVGTTGASVVYQFYNTATNSLDTVFG